MTKKEIKISTDPEYIAMVQQVAEKLGVVAKQLGEIKDLFLESLKGSLEVFNALPDLPETGVSQVENKDPA